MRELKFRAWWKGRYVYDVAPSQEIGEAVRISQDRNWGEDGEEYPVYDITGYGEEIEQFTGLHDRNGREIYEGDIVHPSKDPVVHYDDLGISGFWPFMLDAEGELENSEKCEVIGNIHENPELIP